MLRKILIPHDGSAVASAVFPIARTLARASGAHVVLLRVSPDELDRSPRPVNQQVYHSLERIRHEMIGPRTSTRSLVRYGDPASKFWLTRVKSRWT